MQNLPQPLLLVTRVALLGLLGFAIIVLAGPVLGIIGAILPFVLVGFLAWCAYHLLSSGPRATWRTLHEAGRGVGAATVQTARFCQRAFAGPAQTAVKAFHGSKQLAQKAWRGMTAGAKLAIEGGVIALSGGVVGALVGLATGLQSHELETTIPLNALLGGLMAAGVWVATTVLPHKKPRLVEVATELPRRTV